MVWLVIVLVALVLVALAWWSSGKARPNNRPDGHAGVRKIQGKVDGVDMFRRPGRD